MDKLELQIKNTIEKYKLCNKKEKIIVALSGGKDSTVTAYVLKKLGYRIDGLHIDLGMGSYSKKCFDASRELCDQLKIKLYSYDIKKEMGSSMCYLRSAIQSKHKGTIKNCAICGVIKKWILNKKVTQIKADKIATGHNLDDEAQTFFMNLLKGSPQLSTNSGAITKNISNKKFTPRIKPLFYIPEEDIRKYAKKKKLPVVFEKCPCAIDSYRIQIRTFLEKIPSKEKINIMKNFDRVSNKLQSLKNSEMVYCEKCGEPSRNKICQRCKLVSL